MLVPSFEQFCSQIARRKGYKPPGGLGHLLQIRTVFLKWHLCMRLRILFMYWIVMRVGSINGATPKKKIKKCLHGTTQESFLGISERSWCLQSDGLKSHWFCCIINNFNGFRGPLPAPTPKFQEQSLWLKPSIGFLREWALSVRPAM